MMNSTTSLPSLTDWIHGLEAALRPLANPVRAAGMAAYMKNQFAFLGIATPARRAAYGGFIKAPMPAPNLLQMARACWSRPEREFQYAAVDLLARHHRQLSVNDLEVLLALAQEKSWWDSVDGLAGVVGDVVRREKAAGPQAQQAMDKAIAHPNLWVRRIAMLHQLGWRDQTDTQRLFGYALTLAPDPDFFARKAIGWALRDYAKTAPTPVSYFLRQHHAVLSPLSRREAAKHLHPTTF